MYEEQDILCVIKRAVFVKDNILCPQPQKGKFFSLMILSLPLKQDCLQLTANNTEWRFELQGGLNR